MIFFLYIIHSRNICFVRLRQFDGQLKELIYKMIKKILHFINVHYISINQAILFQSCLKKIFMTRKIMMSIFTHNIAAEFCYITIAPASASSSPNCSARLLTACVTDSTLMFSLYVNQWFWNRATGNKGNENPLFSLYVNQWFWNRATGNKGNENPLFSLYVNQWFWNRATGNKGNENNLLNYFIAALTSF